MEIPGVGISTEWFKIQQYYFKNTVEMVRRWMMYQLIMQPEENSWRIKVGEYNVSIVQADAFTQYNHHITSGDIYQLSI